ncbi:MAG TPA: hypothetical protein DIW23_00955, partial [Anaerolineae bacterium]|nr:hypothetical protein [Anaerolineae bacterium]
MKIKSLKISNVLSFPFLEDLENSPSTVVFDQYTNILIGPNGSGKSNLIEALSIIMQSYFFTEFEYNDNAMGLLNENDKPIRPPNNNNYRRGSFNPLVKHRGYKDRDSRVLVKIEFNSIDLLNLKFIIDNFDDLKQLSMKYSGLQEIFNRQWDFQTIKFDNDFMIDFNFVLNNHPNQQVNIEIDERSLDERGKFLHYYLRNFNLIQRLIEIGVTIGGKNWGNLKNSFALISSMRQYGSFPNQISIGIGVGNQLNSLYLGSLANSTKNYTPVDSIFQITFTKLGQNIRLNRDGKYINNYIETLEKDDGAILRQINDALEDINLKVHLDSFNPYNDTVSANIYNDKNEKVNFNELSTGQKSIFYLIYSVFGFDLQNGLLVIDEPELHLHTAMQKKYFQILKKIAQPFNLQIILATHSPIFIDESTIQNTFRFSKPENSTIITRPNAQLGQTQKDLLQFLAYTNSSRIFFSDIVILVEGGSDEYFFKYFYDNYYLTKKQTKTTAEFLNIGGKRNRKKWKDFLDLFNIRNAFIGDFDNIQNEGVAGLAGVNYQELINNIKHYAIIEINKKLSEAGNTSKDGVALFENLDNLIKKDFFINEDEKRNLSNLWNYLLERCGISSGNLFKYLSNPENADNFQKIRQEIVKKYSENIYILQQGDLESYLGISKDM